MSASRLSWPAASDGDARTRIFPGLTDVTLFASLILIAALPYTNTLLNAFVYDDNTQVLNNPYIQSFRYLPEIFTTTVWSYVGSQGVTNYYRPIMTFGYLLCYQFFGPLAYGFHLASVLLHVAVVCILFQVTERMFQNRAIGFVAAALFALHPIHTESVAWIAAVTDLELTFFYLLTFWFFLRVARPGGVRSDWAQLGMVTSFVLVLLSKEQALTLPLLATVYEHFYREDRAETTWTQKFWRYGTLWLLSAAYLAFRLRFLGALAPVLQMPNLTWREAFLSAIALAGQYLWKLLWPVHLCAFYVFRKSASVVEPRVLAGLGALVVCALLFLYLWRRARAASFGFLWILVTLAPVLNPRWMAANVFTERYLYLPSIGFCWLVGWGIVRLWEDASSRRPVWRATLIAGLAVIAVLCVVRIVTRNRDWRDDIVLFMRTLAASPDAYHIRNNLGVVYWNRGQLKAAEQEWRRALASAPNHAIILNNLGLAASRQKRYTEAVEIFQRAMRRKPNYTDPHLNLGVVYEETGLKEQAELQYRAAVALSPLNSDAHNRLGKLLVASGRLGEAEEQFRRSVESKPNVDGYSGLGDVYLRRGAQELGESAFKRAVSLNPFDSRAHFGLGEVYAAMGRKADALREYELGLQTDPANPEAVAAWRRLKAQIPGPTLSPAPQRH